MRDKLVLFLNGRRHEIADRWAGATLAEWLRDGQRLTATKVVCSEGDCGACSVLIGRHEALAGNPHAGKIVYRAIDSCIALMFQLDLAHVVTVEGLAAPGELSVVQEAMVACHGSQCGFCTPGFVATMHGLFEAPAVECELTAASAGASSQNGAARHRLSDDALRYGLSGNLCRCTGYAQIIDAGRAVDPAALVRVSELYDEAPMVTEFCALAGRGVDIDVSGGDAPWRFTVPATLDDALAAKAARPAARLICGGTDLGVQRNHGRVALADVICLNQVPELQGSRIEGELLVLGAAATWREVELGMRELLPEFAQILARFGSPQIRQLATVGGNVANASPIADSLPLFFVLEATVRVASTRGVRDVPMEKFYLGYKKLDLQPDEIITELRMRLPDLSGGARLRLGKVSKRRDMDISTVASAVLLKLDAKELIAEARIALGGVGPVVLRCRQAEAALVGQPVDEKSLRAAGKIARGEATPISDVRGSADYRSQLVENLLAKAGHELSLTPAGA